MDGVTKLLGAKGSKGTKMRRKVSKRPPLTYDLAHFIVATGEDLYLKMLLVDNLMHVRRGGHRQRATLWQVTGRLTMLLSDSDDRPTCTLAIF